jgi:hypothetical protein
LTADLISNPAAFPAGAFSFGCKLFGTLAAKQPRLIVDERAQEVKSILVIF